MHSVQKMKDSGIQWIGKIPENWNVVPIKYVANINHRSLSENTDAETLLKYIDISSINSDGTVNSPQNFSFREAPSRARRIISGGDTIISTVRTYLRAVAYFPEADNGLVCSTGFAVLSPKEGVIRPEYLNCWANYDGLISQIVARSVGVSYPAINASEIGRLPCLVPPCAEQDLISKFIRTKTSLINKIERQFKKLIVLLREKRQVIINQAVTKGIDSDITMKDSGIEWIGMIPENWDLIRLKYSVEKIGSGITPRGGSEIYVNEGIPLIRSQNVHFDGLHLDDIVFISSQIHEEMARSRVNPNDVLLNITGASIGRCTVVPSDFGEANVNQHVCIIRPKPHLDSFFVSYYLSCSLIQSLINAIQVGASRQGLTIEDIGSLYIVTPPKIQQQKITNNLNATISQISKVTTTIEKQITRLEEYRQSLIFAAVTGKNYVTVDKEVSIH